MPKQDVNCEGHWEDTTDLLNKKKKKKKKKIP